MCAGGPRGCVRPTHLDIWPEGTRIRHIQDPAIAPRRRADLGERLEGERSARRWTKRQMASELGVSVGTYGDWLKGLSAPTLQVHEEISTKMGWDGVLRRFDVIVALARHVDASSAGEAAARVLADLEFDGQPLKAEILRVDAR